MSVGLLFSTSASEHLVAPILSQTSLRPAQYRLGSFVDGEIMFYLDEPVKNQICFVLGHTSAPAENLLRLLTIVNTLKINGAKKIIPIIPYFGYSRSDKPKALQPINARLFAGFLKHAGASRIITLDLHSDLDVSFFTIPNLHLTAIHQMADYYRSLDLPDIAIASPDRGGVARAREFAKVFGEKQIITITKSRPSDTTAEIRSVSGEVRGKNVILVDDMIETGHTLVEAAKALKKMGARRLFAAVTHCVYPAKGINLLTNTSLFNQILITNSLSNYSKQIPSITILDIAPLISKAITAILSSSH